MGKQIMEEGNLMRAAVFEDIISLKIKKVPIPKITKSKNVLIKVLAASILRLLYSN